MAGDNTNKVTLLFNNDKPNKNGFITENPASPNLSDDTRTETRNYGGSTVLPGGLGRANKTVLKDMFNYEVSSSFYRTSNDSLSVSQFESGRDDLSGTRLEDEIARARSAIEEYLETDISVAERNQAEQDLRRLIEISDAVDLSLLDEDIALISEQIGGDISYNPDFETGSVNFSYLNSDDRDQSDVVGKSYNINSIAENTSQYVFPERRGSGFGSTNDISAGGRNIIDQIRNRYQ